MLRATAPALELFGMRRVPGIPRAVEFPGGTLTVVLADGRATLCGPVEEICRGETTLA